ncbi:MAG: GNAT family N-acetyltransferase [Variibacter sp.]
MLQNPAREQTIAPIPLAPPPASIRAVPRTAGASRPLGRLGSLEVHLANDAKDVRRAQRLRYRVFYGEMSAKGLSARLLRRDADAYDEICDHLLVIDNIGSRGTTRAPRVVGTYRLLRQDVAARHRGFYSAAEFDIALLLARHRNLKFLELGRSCVAPPYRNRRTVNLLWHAIWRYVLEHRIDAMFGCASLDGTDLKNLAQPLSYLHHFAAADDDWRARALPSRRVPMACLAANDIDPRAAWRDLPPLVKGYLRLGARVGDGAVVDHRFGTTDVLIVLPVSHIDQRYIAHFGAAAERHAA